MNFLSSATGEKIKELTQSIYDSVFDICSTFASKPDLYNYDLSEIKFTKKLDFGLFKFHHEIIFILDELDFQQKLNSKQNPILVYQKSLNELKIKVIEDFLNKTVLKKYNGDYEDDEEPLTYENAFEQITQYSRDQGVLLTYEDVKDVWDKVFLIKN